MEKSLGLNFEDSALITVYSMYSLHKACMRSKCIMFAFLEKLRSAYFFIL